MFIFRIVRTIQKPNKMADHLKIEHHLKTKLTPAIQNPNMFGIRALTVFTTS